MPIMSDSVQLDAKTLSATITLPSRGLPYKDKLPGGTVVIKSMTTRDEKILSGATGDPDTKLCMIMQNCASLSSIHPNELLVSDKFYLLMAIRVVSFGNVYEFQVPCGNPSCKTQYQYAVDVTKFPVRMWDRFEEPFYFTLPYKQDKLTLRFLRGNDEVAVTAYADAKLKKVRELGDAAYIPRIAKFITAVNDKALPEADLISYVETLPSRDSQALRSAIEKADCGIDTEITVECPKCTGKETVNLPFTVDFFRAAEGSA